jgi:predicted GTPase
MAGGKIEIAQLGDDILNAVKGVVGKDLPALGDFAKAQLEAIAEQTALIAKGIAAGWIDTEAEKQHWADTLKDMATEFAKTLRALIVITIEKTVNAIINVIKTTVQAAVGVALPF